MRRQFFKQSAALMLSAMGGSILSREAFAADAQDLLKLPNGAFNRSPTSQEILPYRIIQPSVAEDAHVARLYFQYSCHFCRVAHATLVRWGGTLPQPLVFRESPVVGATEATIIPAMAFYAVRKVAANRLAAFNESVYAQIHEGGRVPEDMRVYVIAARSAGVPDQAFADALQSVAIKTLVTQAVDLTSQYKLTSTPSVAIGGKMVITPEATNGVNDAFITLANAVTSKVIIDMAGGAS